MPLKGTSGLPRILPHNKTVFFISIEHQIVH